jgi:polysaccharide biosynthesis/export protein
MPLGSGQTNHAPVMLKCALSFACLVALLSGCVVPRAKLTQVSVPQEIVRTDARFKKEYVWRPGDQIEVLVRRVPEVSRTVTIRPDGYLTLPLLDDVKAAGLTAAELKTTLTKLFAERLLEPEVTVIAAQVPPAVVYVVGDVGNNLAVPLRNASTAIEAITFAGGFRRSAKLEDTAIIRLGEDGLIRALPVTNEAGGQPGPVIGLRTMLLQADDIVFVPESGRSQVARFLDDLVSRPLSALSGIFGLYVNFRLTRVIADQ